MRAEDLESPWEEAEALFRSAEASLPAEKRFERWKPGQTAAWAQLKDLPRNRIFLYFPTGEGKSKTSLGLVYSEGYRKAVVLAPLKTHDAWHKEAAVLGIQVKVYTHEMFRQAGTHTPTNVPWIIDEYHKLGDYDGAGFKKWKKLSTKISELVVGMSATPFYNKPSRAWCMEVAFDNSPIYNYGDWIYKHCETEPNPFGYYPKVLGFLGGQTATEYLNEKPWIAYIEDQAVWTPYELVIPSQQDFVFDTLNYSRRHHRITASDMEHRHKANELNFIDEDGLIHEEIREQIELLMYRFKDEHTKWLIFCSHKTVAEALYATYTRPELTDRDTVWMITGDTKDYATPRDAFIQADEGWLIGTTAIAEGVDGLDKTCHALLLLDDIVGDGAKRRQVIGRILPRGKADDAERIVVTAVFGD
ncbi:DNA helicase [Microbacterium phage Fede]|nr:DNA helicase [Microbacterium phage Fede]